MINVHDELLNQVDHSEFWLLVHIVKRLNKDQFCFPSNKLLLQDTGWSIDKLQKIKRSLQDKGIIRVEARYNSERQTSNVYYLTSPYIGAYMDSAALSGWKKIYPPEISTPTPEKNGTDSPPANPTTEVLTINEPFASSNDDTTKTGNASKKAMPAKEHPAYKGFVDVWHRYYPQIGFKFPRDGKVIKNLITKTREIMIRAGMGDAAEDPVKQIEFFDIAIANLPEWYRGKILPVIESHFPTIIDQITNGTKKFTAKGVDQFSDFANLGGVARG